MKYFITPEFHRNLWLRFSPFGLAAVPVVIALIIFILVRTIPGSPFEELMNMALTGYFLVVLVWGNYEAATALQDEVKGKTWDFQRMSPISPGRLAFGKLYGATSFVWYIGLILAAIFVYSYSHYTPHIPERHVISRIHNPTPASPGKWQQDSNGFFHYVPMQPFAKEHDFANAPVRNYTPMPPPAAVIEDKPPVTDTPDTPENILFVALFLILSGLAGHAAAFLVSVSDFSAARNKLGRLYIPGTIGPFIIGVICSSSIYNAYVSAHLRMFRDYGTTTWFGATYDARIFLLLSILFFLGWIYMGIYRTVRAELMYPQTPIGWMIAVPVISFYVAGFVDTNDTNYPSMLLLFLFFSILAVIYITMLLEAADIEKYRRFFSYWKQANWRKAFQNMPRWVSLLGFLALLYFSMLAVTQWPLASVLSLLTTFVLFAVRDGIFVHGLYMGTLPRYVRFYKGTYYLLVYFLLPMLYGAITGELQTFVIPITPQRLHRDFSVLSVFYPTAVGNPLAGILPVLFEIVAALMWLHSMKKKLREA